MVNETYPVCDNKKILDRHLNMLPEIQFAKINKKKKERTKSDEP